MQVFLHVVDEEFDVVDQIRMRDCDGSESVRQGWTWPIEVGGEKCFYEVLERVTSPDGTEVHYQVMPTEIWMQDEVLH